MFFPHISPTDVFLWINLLRQFLTKSTLKAKVKKEENIQILWPPIYDYQPSFFKLICKFFLNCRLELYNITFCSKVVRSENSRTTQLRRYTTFPTTKTFTLQYSFYLGLKYFFNEGRPSRMRLFRALNLNWVKFLLPKCS